MIYDCFTYLNEKEILEIRINELKDLSPIHICVESTHTFVGNEKPIEDHNYKNIIHRIVRDMPNNGNPWDNEKHQRNEIKKVLNELNLNDDDIIILSDVDEIPKSISIKNFIQNKTNGITSLVMDHFGYYLNLMAGYQCWRHAKVAMWKDFKNYTPQEVRHDIINNVIENAGWHFGWIGDENKIIYKFKNFSHQEDSVQKQANIESIKNKIKNNKSLWGEDYWELKDFSIMPKYVQENISKFRHVLKMPHFYDKIGEDWFTYPKLYKSIVDLFDSGHFVEVGSWKGRSAAFMATEIFNSRKNITFDCVDIWEYTPAQNDLNVNEYQNIYEQFCNNTKPVKDFINPIKGLSVEVAKRYKNESLDFVFIDAAHDYDNVKADIEAWFPKVKIGGFIAGHDYESSNGVRQAVDEKIKKYNTQEGCWIHKKIK